MAYNGFPATYQQPYPYIQQAPTMPQQQITIPQQTQNNTNGIVRVQSENEARMYPVAPGNSVMFVDETAPYCYSKTVDMSQLDRPKFEKYRLVKEDPDNPAESSHPQEYALKKDVEELKNKLLELQKKVNRRNAKRNRPKTETDH